MNTDTTQILIQYNKNFLQKKTIQKKVLITFCKIISNLEFSRSSRDSCHYGYFQF